MTVGEAIKMIVNSHFRIRGSYSGKIYYQSWVNNEKRLKQFENEHFYAYVSEMRLPNIDRDEKMVEPIICVYMDDYDKCISKGEMK